MKYVLNLVVSFSFLAVGHIGVAQESSGTVTSYSLESDFESVYISSCGALTDLVLEDFTGGVTETQDCIIINSNTNLCYDAGEIEEGIEITGTPGHSVFYLAPGFIGNANPLIRGGTYTIIKFDPPVEAGSLMYFNQFGTVTDFRLYNETDGLELLSTRVSTTGIENYFGFISEVPIARIEMDGMDGDDPGFNMLKFGQCAGLSVRDNLLEDAVVYPNPFSEEITITPSLNFKIETIQLLDISGRIIDQFDPNLTNQNTAIDLSYLKPGVYFLKILSQDGANTLKKIIKN